MKDEIILNNLGLIYKAIKDLNCNYATQDEFEDYYFAGLVGLIKASKTYDPSKSKSSYLLIGIKKQILVQFATNSRKKRLARRMDISLNKEINDTELGELIVDDYNLEKKVLDKVLVEELLDRLKNKRYKTFLIEYYGIGKPQLNMHEIGYKYGVSHQFVHNSIKYALYKLKNFVKEKR